MCIILNSDEACGGKDREEKKKSVLGLQFRSGKGLIMEDPTEKEIGEPLDKI